ncbi:MAG: hypothetical protein OXU36_03500 [Candidatus Poribacteria bacterium]|nr:hypothetical protein [Candidatus Poribacteria bacterium]
MKNIAYIFKAILIIYTLLVWQTIAGAVIWEDTFEKEAKDDWQHKGNDSIWKMEDGFLKAEIHAQTQWSTVFELYQFIAYPGPHNDFTITLETVGANHAQFGIALAKYFLNPVTKIEEYGYYLFFTNDMQALRNGSIFVGPGKRWNTDELQQMTLHFESGRFQLKADGESRMDFRDANFNQIDIIAFALAGFVTEDVNIGSAWVDTFTIDGLAVSPKRKLTTTWASLKQEKP